VIESLPTPITKDIKDAAKRLQNGQIVAFPTETVYGLGASVSDLHAIARVFEAKQRPSFDPLIVHVADIDGARVVTDGFSATARRLAERFWPGPMTLVLRKTEAVPDLVTSGLPGVGIRIPQHPVAQQLLAEVGGPVAAPSANPFGGVSPTTAEHVQQGLNGRIDAILDGGACSVGLESTVISLMGDTPVVLRLGGLPVEAIEHVIGPVTMASSDPDQPDAAQPAPGMLSRHYAPKTPVHIIESDAEFKVDRTRRQPALLTWGSPRENENLFATIERLSATEDLTECAANFFAALRCLDSGNPDVIIARRFPDRGLGRALNDRLERASGSRHCDKADIGE
jgi:L-threonylcarbamoyladenylate synthase